MIEPEHMRLRSAVILFAVDAVMVVGVLFIIFFGGHG